MRVNVPIWPVELQSCSAFADDVCDMEFIFNAEPPSSIVDATYAENALNSPCSKLINASVDG